MEMREAEKAFEAWCVNGETKGLISKSCWLAGVKWERQRMGELGSKVINRMVEAGSNLIKSEAKLEQQLAEKDKIIEKLRECVEFYADKRHIQERFDGYRDKWQAEHEWSERARQCLKEIEGE